MTNDPSRKNRDYADIENVVALHKDRLDWGLLKEYFELFEKKEMYEMLKRKYAKLC